MIARDDTPTEGGRRSAFLWWAFAVVAMLAVYGLHIAGMSRFLFWDDTQSGAYGQWYHLGRMLLDGTWTILDPAAWQAGNYLAEGQWGILSPLWMLFGLLAVAMPNAVIMTTVVKVGLLIAMSGGVFLLARSFGAAPRWAALAASAAPVGGMTLYFDAPSWVTGLACTALLPWAWWGLRRISVHGLNPAPHLIAVYLLVASGYVAGTIALVFVFAAELVAAIVGRRRVVSVLVAGVIAALLTAVVFLPGMLTAPVTDRSNTGVMNDLFFGVDMSDLATGSVSAAMPTVTGFWGAFSAVPLQYIAWFLPLAVLLVGAPRGRMRGTLSALVFGGLMLALILGPSIIGPLRWPARYLPYLTIVAVVVFAVVATRAFPARISVRRRWAVIAVLAAGLWFAWSQAPGASAWAAAAVGVQLLAFLVILFVQSSPRVPDRRRPAAVVAAMIVTVVVAALPQFAAAPLSPLPNFSVTSSRAQLENTLPDAPDGIMAVGDVFEAEDDPAIYDEVLLGNLWFVSGHVSPSSYTVLPFSEYRARLCLGHKGESCSAAFRELFSPVEGTAGTPLADVMGLNTVIVMQSEFRIAPTAPAGWSRIDGEKTWRYQRDEVVPTAGGVGYVPEGTRISDVDYTTTSVTFTVDAVAADDPEIVLSRLAYPGYRVDGAEQGEPREGFLLTADLSGTEGSSVTIDFRPPGWLVILPAGVLAVALGLGWSLFTVIRRRRS